MLKKTHVFLTALKAIVIAFALLSPVASHAEDTAGTDTSFLNALTIPTVTCQLIDRSTWGLFAFIADGVNFLINLFCGSLNGIAGIYNFGVGIGKASFELLTSLTTISDENRNKGVSIAATGTNLNQVATPQATQYGQDLIANIVEGAKNSDPGRDSLEAYKLSLAPENVANQVTNVLNATVLPVEQIQQFIKTIQTIFPSPPTPDTKKLPVATMEALAYGQFYVAAQLNEIPINYILALLGDKQDQGNGNSLNGNFKNLVDSSKFTGGVISNLVTQAMMLFAALPQIIPAVGEAVGKFIQNSLIAVVGIYKMAIQAVNSTVGNQIYQNALASQPDIAQLKKLYG